MELMNIENYSQYKTELDAEINKTANSFCKIGYLLKLARDTDILKESGYSSYTEFAKAEYGLDKSQVSRFIAINDRFSIEGNSEQIEDKYAEYGSSKLSIMLTLPDAIVEELDPSYSKSDLQAIKEEYDEEQKISDIEVMMEPKAEPVETEHDEFIAQIVKILNDENEDEARYMKETVLIAHDMGTEPSMQDIQEAYAPDGSRTYSVRISGMGRFEVMMKPENIVIINIRDETKSPVSWEEFMTVLLEDLSRREFKPITKPKEERQKKTKVAKTAKVLCAEGNEKKTKPESKPPTEAEEPATQSKNAGLENTEDTTEAAGNTEDHIEAAGEEETVPVKIHELKTLPEYFRYSMDGTKRFELRKDDRGFAVGDRVVLKEWDGFDYTGRSKTETIRYILRDCPDYGLSTGYCILGF